MTLEGLRVAVVFGSTSPEHEISIITACQAMPVLRELGATVWPVYVTKQGQWFTDPSFGELTTFRKKLPEAGSPVSLELATGTFQAGSGSRFTRPREVPIDVLFPLTHGGMGEDGVLAALAGLARIPVVGCGPLAGALSMDKFRSKQLLASAGLPVVPAQLVSSAEGALERSLAVGFPLVVKPNRSGSSIGVSLVGSADALAPAVELAFAFDSEVVLEPAVELAQDLNCAVRSTGTPRASEVERPLKGPGVLSYSDKYAPGGQLAPKGSTGVGKGDLRRQLPADIPAHLRQEIQQLSIRAFDLLGCRGTARIDFLLSGDGVLNLNEVNTIPGSLAFYLWEATGVPFQALLEQLVQEALAFGPPRQGGFPDNLLAAEGLLGK